MKNRSVISSLNRREFIATTSVAAISHVAARADASKNAQNLAVNIHPDVLIHRDELARNANAFWTWKNAVDKLTPLYDFSEKFFKNDASDVEADPDELDFELDFFDVVDNAEHPLTPFPEGEAGNCVRAWLESCKEPLDLVDSGITQGRYQIPQEQLFAFLDDANAIEDVVIPSNVARLKMVSCSSHLKNGDDGLAAKTVSDLLEMSRMVLSGDGYLVHYLVAMAVHTMAMEAVNAFAFHPNSSPDTLRDIRRLLLKGRPAADSLGRVFRMEVVYFTQREVSRISQSDDLRELVDALIKQHLMLNDDDPNAAFSNDEQVRRVRNGMLTLFDGHPQPFDAADTVRLYSGVVATMLSDLSSPWLKRKKELASTWLKEIDPWPQPLWFINDLIFSLFGEEKEERAVTNKEVAKARKALLKVQNPVGKQMLHYLDSFEGVRRSYHIGRLRTDVGLVLIACRLFRDREKRLPRQLSELVDADLVESVPLDPFSGHEIRYDLERRLVWSFGIDEEDNGGDWDFETDFPDGKDFVWRIPSV